MKQRKHRGTRPTIHLIACLAVLAVPAVSWALPQKPVNDPPGLSRGGGGGADPTAGEPGGRQIQPAAPSTAKPTTPPMARFSTLPAATQPPAPATPSATAPARPAAAAEPAPEPLRAPVVRTQAAPTVGGEAARQAQDPLEKVMAAGAATAAALHGAIAVQDWASARREQAALQDLLTRMRSPDLRAPTLAARVVSLQRLSPVVASAIARRDSLRANDAAYRLVYGLVDAITAQSSAQGGGGGQARAAAPASVTPPVDHLRKGYPEVLQAHAAVLRGEPLEAKAHLDAVREHLQTALKSRPGAVFARRLDDLNKRRWRVVAALDDPARAQQLSIALTRAYAEAVHVVGQVAAVGGGGGTTVAPRRARAQASRSLRAIQRPAGDRTRGVDAVPYDKRGG